MVDLSLLNSTDFLKLVCTICETEKHISHIYIYIYYNVVLLERVMLTMSYLSDHAVQQSPHQLHYTLQK